MHVINIMSKDGQIYFCIVLLHPYDVSTHLFINGNGAVDVGRVDEFYEAFVGLP